ncbi:MAG TPA: DEAD/DEAH box helicase, partial [Bacteroidales bacterium]|nr:DEAD/DEAH box helicase [Bacteroidales bacterium]
AQKVIQHYQELKLDTAEVVFDYSGTKTKVSILEDKIGLSGWLKATKLQIKSINSQEHIFISAFADDGGELDDEFAVRLFSLNGIVESSVDVSTEVVMKLNDEYQRQKQTHMDDISSKNSDYFETEMQKLENWAEDKKRSLEIKLKELDVEIKTKKTESKKILKLEDKLKAQRHIKDLESKRNDMRRDLYAAQDEVDRQKDTLIDNVEKMLQSSITEDELFVIKWKIV